MFSFQRSTIADFGHSAVILLIFYRDFLSAVALSLARTGSD